MSSKIKKVRIVKSRRILFIVCLKYIHYLIKSDIQIENHIGSGLVMMTIFVLSEDFVKVADTKDIQPSHMKEVEVEDENICVVNIEGKYMQLEVFAHMKAVPYLMARF